MKCQLQPQPHRRKVSQKPASHVWAADTERPSQHDVAFVDVVSFTLTPSDNLVDESHDQLLLMKIIHCAYVTTSC